MKNLLLLSVFIFLLACKGDIGPQGPQGATGATGATGPTGPTGPAGQNATQPLVYDFQVDISKTLPSFTLPKLLDAYDVVFAYVMTNKGSGYSPLPYRGYAYTADQKDFMKLDLSLNVYTSVLFFDNATSVPTGSTFWIRAVIVKGTKAGRLATDGSSSGEKTPNYEELKRKFSLPD